MYSKKLTLLWVDLRLSKDETVPDPLLGEYFDVVKADSQRAISKIVERDRPDVVCFEFDYPERAGLRLVEEVKRFNPSCPMFVVSLQHSEDLAVWAFRSGMIDFFAKPIDSAELKRCHSKLMEIALMKRSQQKRTMKQPENIMPQGVISSSTNKEADFDPALYYVEQNFRKKIVAEDVAKLCRMSSFRFSRGFKEIYGVAFREYVVRYRLREAYHMLETGHASVTDTAYACGFNDVAYFSRVFKKYFGLTPSMVCKSDAATEMKDSSPTQTLRLPVH